MDFGRLQRGEYIGFAGAAVLALALILLDWFSTNPGNDNANIGGSPAPDGITGWDAYSGVLAYLILAAGIAPFVLAWIVIRQHKLTWRPGEITMIVGMIAFALIILNGIILGRPGDPDSEINLEIGYFIGLLGAAMICAGGIIRQAEGERTRKPPGSL
jgi:drug/metabolite transporter (DMT)-like permease